MAIINPLTYKGGLVNKPGQSLFETNTAEQIKSAGNVSSGNNAQSSPTPTRTTNRPQPSSTTNTPNAFAPTSFNATGAPYQLSDDGKFIVSSSGAPVVGVGTNSPQPQPNVPTGQLGGGNIAAGSGQTNPYDLNIQQPGTITTPFGMTFNPSTGFGQNANPILDPSQITNVTFDPNTGTVRYDTPAGPVAEFGGMGTPREPKYVRLNGTNAVFDVTNGIPKYVSAAEAAQIPGFHTKVQVVSDISGFPQVLNAPGGGKTLTMEERIRAIDNIVNTTGSISTSASSDLIRRRDLSVADVTSISKVGTERDFADAMGAGAGAEFEKNDQNPPEPSPRPTSGDPGAGFNNADSQTSVTQTTSEFTGSFDPTEVLDRLHEEEGLGDLNDEKTALKKDRATLEGYFNQMRLDMENDPSFIATLKKRRLQFIDDKSRIALKVFDDKIGAIDENINEAEKRVTDRYRAEIDRYNIQVKEMESAGETHDNIKEVDDGRGNLTVVGRNKSTGQWEVITTFTGITKVASSGGGTPSISFQDIGGTKYAVTTLNGQVISTKALGPSGSPSNTELREQFLGWLSIVPGKLSETQLREAAASFMPNLDLDTDTALTSAIKSRGAETEGGLFGIGFFGGSKPNEGLDVLGELPYNVVFGGVTKTLNLTIGEVAEARTSGATVSPAF